MNTPSTECRWVTYVGIGILVVLALWGLFSLAEPASVPNEVFRVGAVEALSGNASYYGELTRQGVEIAQEELLKEYPNLKLEVFHQDSFYTPKGGVEAYQSLRAQNMIDAVITHGSPIALSVKPMAEQDGILQMAVSASVADYSTPNDLSFRTSAPTDLEAAPMASFINKQGYERLAVLYFQNDIGVSITESLTEELAGTGTEVVLNEGFLVDASDFRTQLARIRQAEVDAVYVAGLASNIANILNQADELGIDAQFLGFRASEDPVLIDNAPETSEGFIYTYAFDPESSEASEFTQVFEKKYNKKPDGYAAEGYVGLKLMVEAFIECGKDNACIQEYLSGLDRHPSILGPLSFDENGDVSYEFFLKTVRNGEFVRLEN